MPSDAMYTVYVYHSLMGIYLFWQPAIVDDY